MKRTRSAGKTPGKEAAPRHSPRKKARGFMGSRDEEENENKIWIDPADALSLECAICYEPFEAEVFMCSNGHAACAKCCVRCSRKCWCCNQPIGDIRCRPAEKMLAEMSTTCKFSKYGCTEVVKYVEKRLHEEACPRAPSGCPVDGCSYRGLLLSRHLLDDHADAAVPVAYLEPTTVTLQKSAPFRVLVLEERAPEEAGGGAGSVFLLLNGGGVLAGRSLSLVRLGPRPEGDDDDGGISYKMEVRGSEPGVLSLAGTAACVRERELEGFVEEARARMFLFVPDANWAPSGRVSVSILIG